MTIYYFRDKDKNEVDFVLENASGDIVGIEVKATASVNRRDFSGLDRLASIAGTKFIQGIILYEGEHVLGFGDKLCVAPISVLWN